MPALERLEAHQGLIVQTLASMRATLARSASIGQSLRVPKTAEVFRRLEEIGEEAQAVEEAVEEVLTLGRA